MRILLEKWFSYEKLDWEATSPVTVIGGLEGAGKTALRDGIDFILRGICRGVATKKLLARVAIREGCDSTRGAIQIPGLIQVVRTMDLSGSQELIVVDLRSGGERYEGRLTDVEPKLFEILGVEPQQAHAALNAWAFLDLSDAQRRELLFSTDASNASREQLGKAFGALHVEGEECDRALSWVLTSGFRQAEKNAASERASAKRDMGGLERPEASKLFHWKGDPADSKVDLSKKSLQAFEDELARKREAHEGVAQAVGQSTGELKAEIRSLQSKIADRKQALVDLGDHRDLDIIKADLAHARSEIEELDPEVEAADALVTETQAAIGALPAIVDPDVFSTIEGVSKSSDKAVRRHFKQNEDASSELADKLTRAQATASDRRFHLDAARSKLGEFEEEIENATSFHDRAVRLRNEIEQTEKDLENQQAALADAGRNQNAEPLTFARDQVDRAEAIRDAKRDYEDALAGIESFEANREEIQQRIDRWDAVAQALKPSGVESILLRSKLTAIRSELAHVASFAQASIDEDLVLSLNVDGSDRIYPKLSRAQRMRLGIAFQHVICQLTGFPVLIIDEFDTLDPNHKASCLEAMLAVAGGYDAVVLLFTLQKPIRKSPVEGVSAFELREGQLHEATE